MSKDRASPFSRKHRKYWIPVTGGMLLIGAINVGIGVCSYSPARPQPQRIIPVLPAPTSDRPPGTLGRGEIPAQVMRAFTMKYPRTIPSFARKLATPGEPVIYELTFQTGASSMRVTYRDDGTFLAEAP